jgi:hypothetical protein
MDWKVMRTRWPFFISHAAPLFTLTVTSCKVFIGPFPPLDLAKMASRRRSTQATSLIPLGDEWSAATEVINAAGQSSAQGSRRVHVSAISMSQRFPRTIRSRSAEREVVRP